MNTLQTIFEISKNEKKSLIERALKLSEETGEVAEAVLSTLAVPGCEYKEKTMESVIEEAVDVIIVAGSIIEEAGVSEKFIAKMFELKLDKWKESIEQQRSDR